MIDQEQFAKEFKNIVSQKGLLSKSNQHVSDATRWDKNGSHADAIEKALKIRDKVKAELKIMLKGIDYEGWKAMSKKLSNLNGRLQRAKTIHTREKIEKEINSLTFAI